MLAHEVPPVYEKQDKDNHDRQPDAVPDLRENENLPEGDMRDQDNPRPYHNQKRVKAVKDFRFLEFVVDPGFKS